MRSVALVLFAAIGLLLSPALTPVAAAAEGTLRVPNDLGDALLSFGFIAAAVVVGCLVASILRR